jgi:hypothetical protein
MELFQAALGMVDAGYLDLRMAMRLKIFLIFITVMEFQ